MRRALELTLGQVLRVFFRRIDWVGEERIPASGPVIFALNHPNGLIDPLLLLIRSPRPACFLAKAPLFDIPVVGWWVKRLDCIPIHRLQDDPANMDKNRETFAIARRMLTKGRAIAVFPEGVSHSDPGIKPLKTGAARIALGARLPSLHIVPGALLYSSKMSFRSRALLYFGEPIEVPLLKEGEETSRLAIRELTDRIRAGLQRSSQAAREHAESRLPELRRRTSGTPGRKRWIALLTVPAVLGVLTHYPVYRLTGWLATRLSKNEDDVVATFKLIGAMLLFPLSWALIALATGAAAGWAAGWVALTALPLLGLAALRWVELLAECPRPGRTSRERAAGSCS